MNEKISERIPLFFSSDWHLGHENVLKYDNRPFKDLDHMHRVLVNNYNAIVPPNGVCYFTGDMGFRTGGDTISKIINELNGTRVLLIGNHDRGMHSMYAQGFHVVMNAAMFYLGQNRITMSHCPLPGIYREDITAFGPKQAGNNWHGEHKNQMFMTWDKSDFHLHGHIHSDNSKEKPRQTHNQYDVGVRANNYRPVSISQIESWIASTRRENGNKGT